eukprot:scaffold18341_cov20-Tisochrysis_lutea.AAC.2
MERLVGGGKDVHVGPVGMMVDGSLIKVASSWVGDVAGVRIMSMDGEAWAVRHGRDGEVETAVRHTRDGSRGWCKGGQL